MDHRTSTNLQRHGLDYDTHPLHNQQTEEQEVLQMVDRFQNGGSAHRYPQRKRRSNARYEVALQPEASPSNNAAADEQRRKQQVQQQRRKQQRERLQQQREAEFNTLSTQHPFSASAQESNTITTNTHRNNTITSSNRNNHNTINRSNNNISRPNPRRYSTESTIPDPALSTTDLQFLTQIDEEIDERSISSHSPQRQQQHNTEQPPHEENHQDTITTDARATDLSAATSLLALNQGLLHNDNDDDDSDENDENTRTTKIRVNDLRGATTLIGMSRGVRV